MLTKDAFVTSFTIRKQIFISGRRNKFTAMAKVQVLNVAVLDNPSPFGNPFQFEITFECMEDLPEGEYCINCLAQFLSC